MNRANLNCLDNRAESLTISESCVLSASPSFPLVVAALIAQPVIEPISDWAVQVGTNLNITSIGVNDYGLEDE